MVDSGGAQKNIKLVIIPTYNESQNIALLINNIRDLHDHFDVLVIDDNSPDHTGDIVEKIAEHNADIHLIRRPGKLGLGTAYIHGFTWALERKYAYIFTMDADLSHNSAYLPVMSEMLTSHDMVIGSRYVAGGGVEGWPLKRKILSRVGNIYAQLVTGMSIHDCTSGFNALRRSVVEELISKNIHSEGYSFLLEIKYFVWSRKFSIKEVPIIFVDRIAGVSKISKKIIVEALALAWKLRFKGKSAHV